MAEITTITLKMSFMMGTVNCYLLQAGDGFVLVDTGGRNRRAELEQRLAEAGCEPGKLRLIALTHGDFDHTGNVAHLAGRFDAPIAMHPDDWEMLSRGDMFANRKRPNVLVRGIAGLMFGFGKDQWATPGVALEESTDLREYGLAARVVSIPGHSRGSVGILTEDGDLLGGDLLDNTKKPELSRIMDDKDAAASSVETLRELGVRTVYPGHGEPFAMADFLEAHAP